MADVTLSPSGGSPSIFGRFGRHLRGFLGGVQEGWRAYRRHQALSVMSDRALARIGLTRDEIAREAMFPSKWHGA